VLNTPCSGWGSGVFALALRLALLPAGLCARQAAATCGRSPHEGKSHVPPDCPHRHGAARRPQRWGVLTPGRSEPAAARQASPAASTLCAVTTTEENKELVRRYYEDANGEGHMEFLDQVLADDYVLHIPGLGGLIPAVDVPTSGQTDEAERI
jgi:hypothetical protein